MGENSTVVLDTIELTDIALRVLKGSAVIEASGVDKELPIKVTSGNLKMDIIKDGIYLFADGKVVVVDGKIRDASNGLVYGKGYQISDDQGYRAQKVKTFTSSLELWSQKRDELIARANLNVANSLRRTPNLPVSSFLDVWLWYPAFGSFIYMPGSRYRSPYGYSYQSAGDVYYGGFGGGRSESSGGGFSNASNGGGGNSSGASSSGGGAGAGGGGRSSAVAPTFQAPPPSTGGASGARSKVD